MNRKKDIIKCIKNVSGRYSEYEVFSDWVKCMALAISNAISISHEKVWRDREKAYLETIGKYSHEESQVFPIMSAMLVETLEDHMSDALGEIYMDAKMGNKTTGQFFTPYNLSLSCAQLLYTEPDEYELYHINEPSCGGGGMIIAMAQILKEKGINYQRTMRVVAQDLDWKAVYMCYTQLSLLGIHAVVVQGNTLAEPCIGSYPPDRVLYTPMAMGVMI